MDKVLLRKNLTNFFNQSDLRTLCFDLGIEYEDLPGTTRTDKARELIEFCIRNLQIHGLLLYCREKRPRVAWQNIFPGHIVDDQQKTGDLSEVDFSEIAELQDSIEKEPRSPIGKFTKLAFEMIRRDWPVQTLSYPEFWEYLQEQEEQFGRGMVLIFNEDVISYASVDHVLQYASKDLANALLTYEIGKEYIVAAILSEDSKMMRIAYKKEIRLPID